MSLTPELVQFIQGGASITVGSAGANLQPEAQRAVGAYVTDDRQRVVVYLKESLADLTLANLAQNPRVAVTLSRIFDLRTLQLKGDFCGARPAAEPDRQRMHNYVIAFAEQLYLTGLPRSLVHRLSYWPAVAVEFRVTDVFDQTPGPGTGCPLRGDEIDAAIR